MGNPMIYPNLLDMIENSLSRMQSLSVNNELIRKMENFYVNRKKREFYVNFTYAAIKYFNTHWNKAEKYKYAVWGCSPASNSIIDYVECNYPKAELVAGIDTYKAVLPLHRGLGY
jgi:hypothetical protein